MQSRRVPLSTFFDTMRLSPFFGTVRLFKFLIFFRNFFIAPKGPPSIFFFNILQQYFGCSKNPKGSFLLHFWHYATYWRLQNKFRKKFGKIFSSIFSFMRTFVVSSCRKSGFRVILSLRYGVDLDRSGLFPFSANSFLQCLSSFIYAF